MAKHCVFYTIQYHHSIDHPRFDKGWYDSIIGTFRDTEENALKRFERAVNTSPDGLSIRLVRSNVLEQKNAVKESETK
jgi:hypothetical protein